MSESFEWYCENCGYLPGSRVTFHETCDLCHVPVVLHNREVRDAEIARLRAEVEVAKDQAQRRREWFAWCQRELGPIFSGGTHHDDNARAYIERLRAEVERLTRERDEPVARLQRALGGDDGFLIACEALIAEKRLRESAEARVAELEEAIGAWAQAHDGTNFSVQSETSAQLRALLSPRPAPLPDLLAEVLPPKCWHCSYNGTVVVKYCMRDGCPETPKFDVGGTVTFKPKPAPCGTCGGSVVTSAPYELDAEDCPDCRGEGEK